LVGYQTTFTIRITIFFTSIAFAAASKRVHNKLAFAQGAGFILQSRKTSTTSLTKNHLRDVFSVTSYPQSFYIANRNNIILENLTKTFSTNSAIKMAGEDIDGKAIAKTIRQEVKEAVDALKEVCVFFLDIHIMIFFILFFCRLLVLLGVDVNIY